MHDLDAMARAMVARWEHGDENHRQWLRDIAIPDLLAALRAVRNEALEAAAYKVDLGQRWSRDGLGGTKFTNEAADAIRALIEETADV